MTSWTESASPMRSGLWEASPLERSESHRIIRELGGNPDRNLVSHVVAFCRVLRTLIPDVTSGRVIDACDSLGCIDIANRGDLKAALKANLVSSHEDEPLFDLLFQMYWDPVDSDDDLLWLQRQRTQDTEPLGEDLQLPESMRERLAELMGEPGESRGKREDPSKDSNYPSYSPDEMLAQKDFGQFSSEEIRQIRRVINRIAPKMATVLSRRSRVNAKGREVDMRRTFRMNLRYGGEIIKLARRRRKVKKLRLALICDVSGSMDSYSKFLLQFIYALENEMTGVEAWVFSTRLTDVTRLLKGRPFDEAIREAASSVQDWSGGTAIGTCLREFSHGRAKHKVNSHTVIIIVSDGWDRGNVALLQEAMKALKRRSHKVIWLNPLLGNPNYQPLTVGMRTALPYLDYFLPAHNLDSLVQLGKTLQTIYRKL
ncbi:MAG: domain containing CoxE-like protein [Dehalococcoidia bacterium]|nr:domain containing CoxE-like protein [Dehalococcoidia bacterium]